MTTEKQIITKFLSTYSNNPCLWNPRDVNYSNKKLRNEAWEELLTILLKVQANATILDVKRKIENMRTAYRKIHKKVLLSRLNSIGCDYEYVPSLWYYPQMEFLNEVMEFNIAQTDVSVEDVASKKRKQPSAVSAVYVQDPQETDSDSEGAISGELLQHLFVQGFENKAVRATTESESVGTTVELNDVTSEKQIITEFITVYKNNPCLWNPRDAHHSNQSSRNEAFQELLTTLLKVQANAQIIDVKRKIENMRTTYRREHKKVLLSQLSDSDCELYVPSLWYYPQMEFLNEVMEFNIIQKYENVDASTPKVSKRYKKSSAVSAVYLQEHQEAESDGEVEISGECQNLFVHENETESESFGRTIGLQLKELEPMQRAIAEKLISEVIFRGRFNKLQMNSVISSGDEMCDNYM